MKTKTQTATKIGKLRKKRNSTFSRLWFTNSVMFKSFSSERDDDGAAGGVKYKKNNQSRARTTTAAKRQTPPHGSSSALACLDRRCSWKRRNATACATFVTKSKGENTWEKTEYKPFFDSGNHIFSKNERFFTILIKI